MKFKKHQTIYVRSMGKALKVTALFTDADETNQYLEKHPDEGVIAVYAQFVFIAGLYDKGTKIA